MMGMMPILTCVVLPPSEDDGPLSAGSDDPHPATPTTVITAAATPRTRLCMGPSWRKQR